MQSERQMTLPLYLCLYDWWFYFRQDIKIAFLVFDILRKISKMYPEKDIIQKIHLASNALRDECVSAQIQLAIKRK